MESWEPKRERLIAEILDYIVDGSLRGEDMMVVLTTLRTLYEEDR